MTNHRWLLSTLCGVALLAGSVTAAAAQTTAATPAPGAATQTVTLKPGQEAGTNTVTAADMGANPNASTQDAQFVLRASAGGQAEVMIGNLAIQRGQTEAERNFGQMLVTDHTKANDALTGIAQTVMLKTAPGPGPMQRAMYGRLENAPDSRFDAMFDRDMVMAHQRTIALFKTEAADGQNPLLKQFATMNLPVLNKHLRIAEQLSPMRGQAVEGKAMGGVDGAVSGNPNDSADQLNARELKSVTPS